jgi:hypothetical protein
VIKPVTKTSWQVIENQEVLGYVRKIGTGQFVAVAASHDINKYDTLEDAVEAVRDHVLTRFRMIEVD